DAKKTDDMLLTTSINCTTDAEDAYMQMKMIYEHYTRRSYDEPINKSGKTPVKAIHYIMSFADSENVTPEYAQKVAMAFVRNTFGDDAQAVIATHTNTSHTHCHVILNSYSISGRKYNDNQATLRYVREHANGVCRALGITPALNFECRGRSMKYNEWEHKKNGTSWKQQIREEIDKLIPTVNSLDELLQALDGLGYEVKRGKYISVKAPGRIRFVRTKTLGEEYTEESLTTRIQYREVGSDNSPTHDSDAELRDAYASVIGDVRILANQHRKVPRKHNADLPYSADNDLDIYRLSAQMSVMKKENIHSLGDLEYKAKEQKTLYEKYKVEVNQHIVDYNKMVSLLEQAKTYYSLAKKPELSDEEKNKMLVCRQAMQNNSLLTMSDVDTLRERAEISGNKISALKEKLEGCRQRYAVYQDILETYDRLSKRDYVAELVEEERQRQEQLRKKKPKR
ncbi:MAG: relaxase/mobilization nuclease domain-containing protein, partial [Ruminococcus sp.]|nr:relaxase/mobilization nuclease domain-containing protein [Ruminococcus sp.]